MVVCALVQMTSCNDTAQNFTQCSELVRQAKAAECEMVFFPECFAFIGAAAGQAQQVAEPLDGPLMQRYQQLAKQNQIWLSLGGFQERCAEPSESRIFNTHVVIDAQGELCAVYRKIHLFDVPMVGLVESKQAMAGSELVTCDSPAGRLGVTICYDMRFPELYQKLTFLHGAQVLLMPSAFAMKTGAAHWETLLRCRAIENQCYVVASAQVGQHNEDGNKRQSWGHACVFDPWGEQLVQMGTDIGIAVFEIDLDELDRVRGNMPINQHRRYDIYGDGPHASERARI